MNSKKRLGIQVGIMITAASFMVYGAFRGEVMVVLTKAINICLECIGLG